MPKASLFSNKVFYKSLRKNPSEAELNLIHTILSKHDLERDYIYTHIIIDDFFGTTFTMACKGLSLLIRTSINRNIWSLGDTLAKFCEKQSGITNMFFSPLGEGVMDDISYSIFQSYGPHQIKDFNPEEKIVLSRFLGAAQLSLSTVDTSEVKLPPLLPAYEDYFNLCTISDYIPLGSEREFNKTSPISIAELGEFLNFVREDFIETLNNLPDSPEFLFVPCFGPLDVNYVFSDPYLRIMPPMFPYEGDPIIDMAINSNLLGLSLSEAVEVFANGHRKEKQIIKYASYVSKELWQPMIVPQLLNKILSYAFPSFTTRSIIDSTHLYNVFCRNRILNSDKYKKFSKSVDTFFLNHIIY